MKMTFSVRRSHIAVIAAIAAVTTVGVPAQARTHVPRPVDGVASVAASFGGPTRPVKNITLPVSANLIGFSMAGPSAIEVRALSRGGWTPWTGLTADPDEAAEGAEAAAADAHVFTHPFWVGTARRIQVRTTDRVRDLSIHYVNTLGDAEPAGPLLRAGRALRDVLTSQPAMSSAQAVAAKPTVITRAGWKADESIGDEGPGLAPRVKMAFVHHTVNSNSYSKSEGDDLVRAIHRYHVLGRGYSDIAYNFLIDRYGQIFEGRRGGIDEAVIGAHSLGFNTGSSGMALIGTFTTAVPPSAMLTSLKKLIAYKFDVEHIPVIGKVTMTSAGNDRYAEGVNVSFDRVSGHRDGSSTSCPGTQTYSRLSSIRSGAAAIGLPKTYRSRSIPTLIRRDGDGKYESMTFSATFSESVAWTVKIRDRNGTIAHAMSGTGTSLSRSWTGKDTAGQPLPSGRYKWVIDADSSKGNARDYSGVIYVINTHPEGTLLKDDAGVYMVENGTARPVSALARKAKYGSLPAVVTGPAERAMYTTGTALGLRGGTLLEDSSGVRYIYSAGTLRRFATEGEVGIDVFSALDYDPADVIFVDLDSIVPPLTPGAPVLNATVHPDGTVIKDVASGQKWVIDGGLRRPISTLARRSRYRPSEVVRSVPGDMAMPEGPAYPVRPGTLVADPSGGRPWLIDGSTRRQFITSYMAPRMGFTDAMLTVSSSSDLAALSVGSSYA